MTFSGQCAQHLRFLTLLLGLGCGQLSVPFDDESPMTPPYYSQFRGENLRWVDPTGATATCELADRSVLVLPRSQGLDAYVVATTALGRHSFKPTSRFVIDRIHVESTDVLAHHPLNRYQRLEVSNETNLSEVLSELNAHEEIAFAQPNCVVHATAFNDPMLNQLWGMTAIAAPPIWNQGLLGAGIVVAVVDTGVQSSHEDLLANMWTNPLEIAGNGLDDDGNGFIDDVHGWNFISNTSNAEDDNGHGTHVAGTIAGVAHNNVGVVGVSPNSKIVGVKALAAGGSGSDLSVANAISYAANHPNIHVMNMSLGGYAGPPNPNSIGCAAISLALNKGKIPVVAAGNDNQNASNFSPGHCPGSFTVSAITSAQQKASFSNFGPPVQVAAPGVSILSTKLGGGYVALNGTSMAAPHVAGVVASVMSAAGGSLSPSQVTQVITQTATDLGTPGRDDVFGYGLVDVNHAAQEAQALSGQEAPSLSAPLQSSISERIILYRGEEYVMRLQASDPNGDTLSFASDMLPEGASLDQSTGLFTWTPRVNGEFDILFSVTDGYLSDDETVYFSVATKPRPPRERRTRSDSTEALSPRSTASYSGCQTTQSPSAMLLLGALGLALAVNRRQRKKSPNPSTPKVLLALGLVSLNLACADREFRFIEKGVDKIRVSGRFCTELPSELLAPVRIFFMIDISGSMLTNDPAGLRSVAVSDVIAKFKSKPNYSFGIISFSDGAKDETAGFTRDEAVLQSAIQTLTQANGGTNMASALDVAKNMVEKEIIEQEDDYGSAQNATFIGIFLGDGGWNVGGEPFSHAQLLMTLKPRVKRLSVNGAFLGSPSDAGYAQIQELAEIGEGFFVHFKSAGDIDLKDFDFSGVTIPFGLADFTLVNAHARMWRTGTQEANLYPDSDGDGLPDIQEDLLGTDPFYADSDQDGIPDKVEVDRAMDPLDDTTDSCHSDVDSDGDGLSDCVEGLLLTDIELFDTDGDGYSDGLEVLLGTDPRDRFDMTRSDDGDSLVAGQQLKFNLNPRIKDEHLKETLGYTYKLDFLEIDGEGRYCYRADVGNITLVPTEPMVEGEPAFNTFYFYLNQYPQDGSDHASHQLFVGRLDIDVTDFFDRLRDGSNLVNYNLEEVTFEPIRRP